MATGPLLAACLPVAHADECTIIRNTSAYQYCEKYLATVPGFKQKLE
jgi:hypothetical protein